MIIVLFYFCTRSVTK